MPPPASTASSRMRRRATVAIAIAALLISLLDASASSAPATPAAAAAPAARVAATGNPIAGGPWGVFKGQADGVWPAYQAASGTDKTLLAKIALRSRVRWFTSYNQTSQIESLVHSYVTDLQSDQGPTVLVPMAFFRQFPNHESNKAQPWTMAMRQDYKNWYDAAAAGIGAARALVILEPDLPVILKDAWRPDIRESLVSYAARTLAQHAPHAAVYIDAGSADWLTVDKAASLLKRSGVANIRGFALGGTHYDTTVRNIRHGRQIVTRLSRLGIPNKHFVIDTADNGHGFTFAQYFGKHPNGVVTNAEPCRTKTEQVCVTLGIPPTWRVADPAWHLPGWAATMARHSVDGYVWYGRPWLKNGTYPFELDRALPIARTTPY